MKIYTFIPGLVLIGIFSLQLGITQLASPLNPALERDYFFLLQEEKMERDVYRALYVKWEKSIFDHISASEQRHYDRITGLLIEKGLEIPDELQALKEGAFAHPELQSLYNDLTARGNQSLEEAFRVGALIEETDIQDLMEVIAELEEGNDKAVFEDLLGASHNHLRAFVKNLGKIGVTYFPVLLDTNTYEAIKEGEHYQCDYKKNTGEGCHGKGKGKCAGNCGDHGH